jgi:hypothetical protein
MASILNNSSFIFNPAGSIISYQEDKVYSVLPNDGSVDGAVGGNSGGGTRVNQQGYIETVPANLLTYSEDFTVGTWLKQNGATVNGNVATAPNGTQTADLLYPSVSSNVVAAWRALYSPNTVPNNYYTQFVYMKSAGFQWAALYKFDGNTGTAAWFDLTNGVLGTVASGVTASIENAGGGWWKCSITQQHVSTNYLYIHIYPTDGNNSIAATPSGTNGIYIWGANINLGSTARPYQPTTDRLGYPPIDYENGKGKLLQEPQRTNLVLYSQQFNISGWNQYNSATVTANTAISPDGTQNAYTLNVATTGYSGLYRSFSGGTGVATVSGFFKKGTIDYIILINTSGTVGVAWFNLANGTIGTVVGGYTATIEPFKDGWYKCSVTGPSQLIAIWQIAGATSDNNVTPAYAGNIYIWGAQVEAGGFSTSYIPTTSATVTRAATDIVFNSPGPTKAFASKPGVILYDFDFYNFADGASYETFLYNNPSAGSDYFYFAKLAGTGQMYWDGNNSGGYFYAGSFVPKQGKNKVAWYFTNTNSYWYVNGSLLYTGTYFDALYFTYMQTYAVPGNNFAINTFASIPDTSISQAQVQAWTNFNSGSGGTVSYSGPFTIHTFTGSATFTPSFTGQVEVLVAAGGGGGGNNHAGGGGAGGLLYVSSYGVTAGTGITVTIGAGGTSPATNPDPVTNGSNSVFGGLTAIGGGGGGSRNDSNNNSPGGSGGSGGGGGGSQASYPGNWVPGNGIPGQGNNGGYGIDIYGGGGGGAGAVGTVGAASSAGGNGGNGLPYSISGFSTYYAGGGGGGYCPIAGGGNGGLGGGGKGGILVTDKGTPGVPYTGAGGGGGGAGGTQGSIGGSGIVIVRYLT